MKAKNIFKRVGAMLLCFTLLAGTFPAGALAQTPTNVQYIDENGAAQSCTSATVVTKDATAWGASDSQAHWYVVQGDVTIDQRVTVTGEVHLILADGCTLNASQGINVSGSNNLTIYAQSSGESMGALTANGGTQQAGIGGGNQGSGGSITINGGTVTAIGRNDGAGIGGGNQGSGSITINGGKVTATGRDHGAGIGGGGLNASGGSITIKGGTVIATGGGGVGIGGLNSNGTYYPFSTGESGHAVIFASSIIGIDDTTAWRGVIFQDNTGYVYGTSVTPTEDFTIPEGYTLTINKGQTLTIPEGVTLTNNGTIINNGTITNNGTIICHGTINGNGVTGGNVSYASAVDVDISGDGVTNADNGYSAPYGSSITITATMQRAQTNGINALAELGEVDFYLGEVNSDNLLETADVTGSDGTYTATLDVTLNDEAKWLPKDTPYTITAVFGGVAGTSGDGLLSSTGTAELTVTKASQPAPDVQGIAETVQGRNDGKIIGLTAGTDYEISSDDGQNWKDAALTGTEITGLAPGTYLVRAKGTETSFAGAAAEVTIAAGAERTYTLHVTAPTFENVYTGYTQPEAKAITITSSGNSDATISSVTVSGDSFTIGGSGPTVLAGGSITTWTIQPAAGLAAGTYTGTITVAYGDGATDNDATATAEVSFVVNQPSGGGSVTYPPVIPTTGNGDVTVSPTRPERGDTVTVTVEPDDRYKVEDVTVTDRNGDAVEVSLKDDGTYTFVQPAGKVEIEVTYAVDMPFTDVPKDAWYIDGAEYVYAHYIMNGTGETTFGPNTTVSRSMIVQILHNLAGNPDVEGDTDFTDVSDDYWSAKAIAWASGNGVVNGFEDGTFRPDESMTREQMAAILQNFASQMGLDVSASGDLSNFTDIPEGEHWSRDALAWAYAEGLLAGTSDSTMDPAGQASRAQIAVIMTRFCEQYVETVE